MWSFVQVRHRGRAHRLTKGSGWALIVEGGSRKEEGGEKDRKERCEGRLGFKGCSHTWNGKEKCVKFIVKLIFYFNIQFNVEYKCVSPII